MSQPAGVAFDRATAPRRVGPGRYGFTFTEDWFGLRGPHGGFLAAVLLRAMELEVGDPGRHPRSLTVHFPAPAAVGDVDIEVREERRGGRLSTVSARMTQEGGVMALALAALSAGREGPDIQDIAMPEVPPPEAVEAIEQRMRGFARHFDYRYALGGAPFSGQERAESGGWMRFVEPAPIDAAAVACLADAWMPAVFPRLAERVVAPTIDLTVHFRDEFPVAGLGPGDFVFGRFWSNRMERGFWEEDGELWTRDGRLLAQSRQLALVIPRPPRG